MNQKNQTTIQTRNIGWLKWLTFLLVKEVGEGETKEKWRKSELIMGMVHYEKKNGKGENL